MEPLRASLPVLFLSLTSLLLAPAMAQADPGRVHAGLEGGLSPEGRWFAYGQADYGVLRHLSVAGEAGVLPFPGQAGVSGGLRVDLLDSSWWRIGIALEPGLHLAIPETTILPVPDPGTLQGSGFYGRGGLRVEWLAFWGLCVTGRVDQVVPLEALSSELPERSMLGLPGWSEIGFGLAVRM